MEIVHISESTVWNAVQFVFILSPSRGLPKYIKFKVLTACFIFMQSLFFF